MKKLLLSTLTFFTLALNLFAGPGDFFAHRIFEIKANVPVNLSNNAMGIGDILTKDVVIDLSEIADTLPGKGFALTVDALPEISVKLNLPHGLIFGVDIGVDAYVNAGISKELFDFLGKGNKIGQKIDVGVDAYGDVFAHAGLEAGWNMERLSFVAKPTLFSALVHVVSTDSKVVAENTEDGDFNALLKAKADIISNLTAEEIQGQEFSTAFDRMFQSLGFDMGGTATYELFDFLSVNGSARIPLVPSKLTKAISYEIEKEYSFNVDDFLKKDEDGDSAEGTEGGNTDKDDADGEEGGFFDNLGETRDVEYYINRPMKLTVGADFHPFGNLMSYYGSLGLGFKHPFAENKDERGAYIDYLIGMKLSAANIINLYLSTERTDEIYRHKGMIGVNIRLLEVDLGIALESSSFANSFKGTGLGGFATVCIGF